MDTMFPLISILVLLILIAIAVVFTLLIFKRQKEGKQAHTDYRLLFIMGIIFTVIGVVYMIVCLIFELPFLSALPLLIIGIFYLIISIINRKKWR